MAERDMRTEFELSMLFHPELTGGKGGFLQKDKRGRYIISKAEYMFMGYEVARNVDADQLRRFSPDRYIGNGHVTEVTEALDKAGFPHVTEDQIRIVLRVVAGWPR